jgi:HEPN domain-containing protein
VTSSAEATVWWLRTALGDLATAQALVQIDSVPARASGQFAQQAAEKALKAAIASTGTEPAWTHDLVYLALRCRSDLRRDLAPIDVVVLSAALARSRYPDLGDAPIARAEATRWVGDAQRIVGLVARHCNVDLASLSAV